MKVAHDAQPRAFDSRGVSRALRRSDLTLAARSVAQALADYANAEGQAWPQTRRLMRDCCLAKSTVRAAIRVLVRRGLITESKIDEGQAFPSGNTATAPSSVYTWQAFSESTTTARLALGVIQGGAADELGDDAEGGASSRTGGPPSRTGGVHGESRRVHPRGPDTLLDRSRKTVDHTHTVSICQGSRARREERDRGSPSSPAPLRDAFTLGLAPQTRIEAARASARGPAAARPITQPTPSSSTTRKATDATDERAEESEESQQVRRAGDGNPASFAAARVLSSVLGARDAYPATWMRMAAHQLAQGFKESELIRALAVATKHPWYGAKGSEYRSSPGFVLAEADRIQTLLAFAATTAPRPPPWQRKPTTTTTEDTCTTRDSAAHGQRLLDVLNTPTKEKTP